MDRAALLPGLIIAAALAAWPAAPARAEVPAAGPYRTEEDLPPNFLVRALTGEYVLLRADARVTGRMEGHNRGKPEKDKLRVKILAGKPALIDLWRTDSDPSKSALAANQRLYANLKDRGLQALGIALDTQEAAAISQAAPGVTYLLAGDDGSVANLYAVASVPMTFLVDKQGKIVFSSIGTRSQDQETALRAAVEKAL